MPLRRVARPLLAATFIASGVDALLNTNSKAAAAKPLLDRAQEVWPGARCADPVLLVQVGGATKVGAGTMLALGRWPRLAAAILAADLIPTTLAEHPFWAEEHPDDRRAQRLRFLKNAGLLGGLLLTVSDTRGKPSLAWRLKRAKRRAQRRAGRVRRQAAGREVSAHLPRVSRSA